MSKINVKHTDPPAELSGKKGTPPAKVPQKSTNRTKPAEESKVPTSKPPLKPPTKEQIQKTLPQILDRFKAGFIEFLDGLIGRYPTVGVFIALRVLINDELPPQKIMDRYVEEFYPYRELIKSRDDSFFLAPESLTSFDKDRLLEIRRVWVTLKMTDKEKEYVFGYFDFFNNCVKKHQDYTKELAKFS